jgi:hypothetical protein
MITERDSAQYENDDLPWEDRGADHDCDEYLIPAAAPNTFECTVCGAICDRLGDYS